MTETNLHIRSCKLTKINLFAASLIVYGMAPVRNKHSEVRTKTTEGQYVPVRLELARLVSSLVYGTWAMFGLNLLAFENKKKYTAYTVRMAKSRPRKNQSECSDAI